SCSKTGGTTLGRLPWKTLGLPDLRDGDGERLWYAVSENFKNNPRSNCDFPGQPTCLNSNTRGTITVYNRYGKAIHDATMQTGAIAVIIAPGAVLRRSGAASEQDRSSAGVNAAVNYLDTSGTEDNADFADNT